MHDAIKELPFGFQIYVIQEAIKALLESDHFLSILPPVLKFLGRHKLLDRKVERCRLKILSKGEYVYT